MNKSDRRKMERFDLKLPTNLSWAGKGKEQELIELMTNNICAGGAYFITSRALPKGTEVKVNLILHLDKIQKRGSKRSHIDVSGFVTRTNHQGMAIWFDKNYKISPHKITDI